MGRGGATKDNKFVRADSEGLLRGGRVTENSKLDSGSVSRERLGPKDNTSARSH